MSSSAAAAPPATEDPVQDLDYIDDEDDGDDEEDDFYPGAEEDDDDDDASEVVPLLDGHLFYGAKHALHYQGEGFHLSSSEAAPWNILNANCKLPKDNKDDAAKSFDLVMSGPCDFETAGAKATPRTIKVTFAVSPEGPPSTPFGKPPRRGRAKGGDEDDEDDIQNSKAAAANDSKAPGVYYSVFGSQMDEHGSGIDMLQFQGGFYPPTTETEKVALTCQARIVASHPPATPAGAAAPVAAAAARVQDDDDDDEADDDADEDVDYNELIALHEDAGMSVADLRKRCRGGSTKTTRSSSSSTNKKLKAAPPPPPAAEDDDDDDEDFDGF